MCAFIRRPHLSLSFSAKWKEKANMLCGQNEVSNHFMMVINGQEGVVTSKLDVW